MATAREVYSEFSVTSGGLCFGGLHNIWQGASVPVQGFPEVRPNRDGTVQVHRLEFNVPAQNGTWTAFHLVDTRTDRVCGWFICHHDVDEDQEIDKILRVSGSPYEHDSGSSMNNDETDAQGVLVINSYDWGWYQKQFMDEIGEGVEDGEGGILGNLHPAGLVDYAQANNQVQEWKKQRLSERNPSKAGVWMYIPRGEYMFGRFGFDDEHTAARSFLFFCTDTEFTHTTFAGLQQPLRKEETDEERFERRLRDGFDFSGIARLREISSPPSDPTLNQWPRYIPPPPESECLGPYDKGEHILRAQDLDSLRLWRKPPHPELVEILRRLGTDFDTYQRDRKIATFVEPWKEPVYNLLNELALSYLERFVIPCTSHVTFEAVAEALFPTHVDSEQKELDFHLYSYFTQQPAEPIPNFDVDFVGARIRDFLRSRARDRPAALDELIAGTCRAVAFLVSEVLELSSQFALGSWRSGITPHDIRWCVYSDPEIRRVLMYSTVFWKGREWPYLPVGMRA